MFNAKELMHYENVGEKTYLVYEILPNDVVDTMSVGMLTHNKIAGLTQTLFTQMNDSKYIKYNVPAKVAISQFFAGAVNKKRLLGVFMGIVDAMISAREYMIDEKTILLNMDYIFTDVTTCDTVLICVPLLGVEIESVDVAAFFRNIMFTTRFDQTENCDYVASIINYLNGAAVFSLEDFKRLLRRLREEAAKTVPTPQPQVQPQMQSQPYEAPKPEQPHYSVPQPQPQAPVYAQSAATVESTPSPASSSTDEKEISFLYLMQHYNKDNAAAYKAQKEAKKGAKSTQPEKPAKSPKKSAAPNVGFAIPGKDNVVETPQPTPQPAMKNEPVKREAEKKPVVPPVQSNPQVAPQQTPPVASAATSNTGSSNFGQTVLFGGARMGGTVMFDDLDSYDSNREPYLIRVKSSERIHISKSLFHIGAEPTYADYCILDNPAISRSHANIICREGAYFVVDTNSTNHTFVNGSMIPSGAERKLTDGDKVRFANEEFEFKLI